MGLARLLAVGLTMVGLTGCGGEAKTVTVYVSLPLQGDFRPLSEDAVRGAKLALEQRDGKVGSQSVKLIALDDASAATGNWDVGLVSANARRAIADEKAVAYIGDANSGATAVAMPLLNEAGLLHVSPTSTYVGLTRAEGAKKGEPDRYRPSGKRTFGRIIPADHHQATAMAELIVAEGVRRLHLVHDRDVYGRGLAELVGKAVRKAGVEVTGTDGIDRKAGNFRGLGNKVSRLKADGVFFGGSLQSRAVQVFRDIGQRAPSVRLFGPDAVALPGFAEEIGKEFEPRVHLTSPALPPEATPPEGREVLKAFREKYQSDPTAFTVYGYEAMSVVLDAIDRAGSDGSDRAHVVDAFFATRSRRSALGTYSIDANGDTTLTSYGAYRVKQGKLAFDRALGSSGD